MADHVKEIGLNKTWKTRCHRCATSRNPEDRGIIVQWKSSDDTMIKVWFHNIECKNFWVNENKYILKDYLEIKQNY